MTTEATVLLDAAFASYPEELTPPQGYILSTQISNIEGLHAEVYQKKNSNEYIISFRGTETSQINDIYTNANLGWLQYERSQSDIQRIIKSLLADGNRIDITGHSLGGALAQFAAYDLAKEAKESGNSELLKQVSLTTWNALGGIWGLQRNGGYDSTIAAALTARHYYRFDDLVVRLGRGHVGGEMLRLNDPEGLMARVYDAHMDQELRESLQAGTITKADPWYFLTLDSSQVIVATLFALALNRSEDIDAHKAFDLILPTAYFQAHFTGINIAEIAGSAIFQEIAVAIQNGNINQIETNDIARREVINVSQDIPKRLLKNRDSCGRMA